jgi:hypothetical protein
MFVVAQFRHVNQWVEAMRYKPYHSPAHVNLPWQEFVTKPWIMNRTDEDNAIETTFRKSGQLCQEYFQPGRVVPCVELEPSVVNDLPVHALYELRNDGSGKPYDSILELRRDKIRNFLDIQNFVGVQGFHAVRYEQLVEEGTASLIEKLEKALNTQARCQPHPPGNLSARTLSSDYLEWMEQHVDWETEALVGYEPPALRNETDKTTPHFLRRSHLVSLADRPFYTTGRRRR